MKLVLGLTTALLLTLATAAPAPAADGKIALVAAENFYGNVAQQIGGDRVSVTSILNSPDQDPHLFEVSPAVVRQIAAARIVAYNGADYDPWMGQLLKVTPKPGRVVINAADLVHKQAGDNPHIWYDPATMPAVARALAAAFTAADPAHKDDYAARLKTFLASLDPLNEKIAAIRGKYADVAVTASEPVFGYMAAALKLKMRSERFQLAVMNDTEPSARDVAAMQDDLERRKVKLFLFNSQVSDDLTARLLAIARAAKVPVVGVTETMPPDQSYQDWIAAELGAVEKALEAGGGT